MLVLQLTDFHVMRAGALLSGVDTRGAFTRLLERVGRLSPKPDLIIASGDLAEDTSDDVYAFIAESLRGLGVPLVVVPGNHDQREPFRRGFAREVGADPEHLAAAHLVDGLHVIALDTLVEGKAHGELSERQLAWLRTELDAAAEAPVLIVMHHPPFRTGLPAMDEIGLIAGRAELHDLLAGRKNVTGLLCGHVHRAMAGTFAGHPVRIAPSASFQFRLDFEHAGRFEVVQEPPQLMLHRIGDGAEGITSYLLPC
ncbi:3',5'-cyclic adenosine monophosphate phosphodiesterase CpdA [Azorhizobium oxalatiphilum]|uniref:3',5'-cyclic adenosine monophosphate phosphodiesterase CpdA n=1 Tax=Azorhizobium oxalatiphilum TaxID=980631 RepID=A0A917BQH4_9HYPH|nr:phosphodiesterase [Azorhizobium oxalatiphilum]GGF50696.1 3',5'-cyclic adenosine monophosphate phosphodiesterase CpdA [Azorhizobium oxalatiphilum]